MTSAHSELEELIGAYVLDAVDDDERDALERHLATCPRCRAEVNELREVTALLANSSTPAPEGVWDRIAASLEEAPPPMRLSVVPPASTEPPRVADRDVTSLDRARARRRTGLAAVAAVAAVVIGIIGFSLGRTSDSPGTSGTGLAAAASTAFGEPGSRTADLLSATQAKKAVAVVRANGEGYLLGENLPVLDSRIYQLWGATTDGTVISLGVLPKPGVMAFHVDGSIQTLMLTEEQRPVDHSSNPPAVVGNLA